MKNNNIIKNAVEKLELSEAAKARIINGCEEELAEPRRAFCVKWKLVAAAALAVVMTVGVAAAVYFRRAPGYSKSHTGDDTDIVNVLSGIEFEPVMDGDFVIKCNSVTGGGNTVYCDFTLTKSDGTALTELSSDDGVLPMVRALGAMLTLSDGSEYNIPTVLLDDSTETAFHMEGRTLITGRTSDELPSLLSGATVTVGDVVCETGNTTSIVFAKENMKEILKGYTPDTATPDKEPYSYVEVNGEQYLRTNNVTSRLAAGGLEIPLSADGRLTVDNFGYGAIGYAKDDGTQPQALYLNVKGFEYREGLTTFEIISGDGSRYGVFVSDRPANGVLTLVINDDTEFSDIDSYDLANIVGISVTEFNYNVLCSFKEPIRISGDYKNASVKTDFEEVTIKLEGGDIVLRRAEMNNAEISLFGDCTVSGPAYDLDLESAFAILENGEKIALGGKTIGGSTLDGECVIGWQLATTIDPEKIVEIHVNGAVVKFK